MPMLRYDWDRIIPWLTAAVNAETAYVGSPPSLRRCHYLIVKEPSMAGTGYANETKCYKSLAKKLTALRDEGTFPDLEDSTRAIHEVPRYGDLEGALRHLREALWFDRTVEVPVMIAVEKDTLLPMVNSRFWWLPTTSMRGYTSMPHVQRVARTALSRGLKVLYVGDADPSGLHMSEVDLPRRTGLEIERVALTIPQARDLETKGLANFEAAKDGDARVAWMKATYGGAFQVEAEAMDPSDIISLLGDRVEALTGVTLDADYLPDLPTIEAAEEAARDTLDRLVDMVTKGAI